MIKFCMPDSGAYECEPDTTYDDTPAYEQGNTAEDGNVSYPSED